MRPGTAAAAFIVLAALLLASAGAAFTTDELVRLKQSGLSEETIVALVEGGYTDSARVIRLKESGFRDESILAILRAESKGSAPAAPRGPGPGTPPPPEKVDIGTTARVRIEWFMVHRGDVIRQNHRELDNATASFVDGKSVKIEFRTDSGLGLLEVFRRTPFRSPFYWDVGRDDVFGAGKDGYRYALKSTTGHRGRPGTDGSHFWVLSIDPKDAALADRIREAVAAAQ